MAVGFRTHHDPSGVIAEAVFEQVRRSLPPHADCVIVIESPLDEIGLDSLARMDVLNRLEEAFGLRFSEESLYDMVTCRDVVEYIDTNARRGEVPRQPAASPVAASAPERPAVPAEHCDVTQFPECVAFANSDWRAWRRPGWRTRSFA